MIMLQTVLFSLFGFAMGSILYSYLLPKLFTGLDITQCSEDGNPGATNAILYGSVRLGALCLALDIAKGALPVFWATRVLDPSSYLFVPVMLAPVLGHAFSPFLKGRGGKGIAVTFGVLLGVLPLSPMVFSLAALLLFFTFVIKITPDGVRVILAMLLFLILCFQFDFIVHYNFCDISMRITNCYDCLIFFCLHCSFNKNTTCNATQFNCNLALINHFLRFYIIFRCNICKRLQSLVCISCYYT